ncbi:acetyl-CoA synthetase-like protein [Sesbania bispinosa]|nr:acetyl-CoA synthetase-like protein [Sesbania bispinosa]
MDLKEKYLAALFENDTKNELNGSQSRCGGKNDTQVVLIDPKPPDKVKSVQDMVIDGQN